MITIKNTQRTVPVNTQQLKAAATTMLASLDYADYDLGILLTGTKTMRTFNKTYRGKDKVTDILSFPYHTNLKPGKRIVVKEPEDKNLGDIIICPLYVQKDAAKKWDRPLNQRFIALLAHGIAHLLGYDHETDADYVQMLKLEKGLIRASFKS